MMRPDYYWEILALIEKYAPDASLSLTTNLWPFYKNPERYVELFRDDRVGITTSFQYGNQRLKDDLTPYTEEEFWNVSNLFLEKIGYRPEFISVITNKNRDTSIKTVELAKRMNVVCKVNYANGSGDFKYFKGVRIGNKDNAYLLSDIYRDYIAIYEAGLHPWEYNTKQLINTLKHMDTTCPLSRNCDRGIRVLQPNGDYYSCGSFGDDKLYPINFEEDSAVKPLTPLNVPELLSMHDGCFSCESFALCNGCKRSIHDTKKDMRVDEHCSGMKALIPKFHEIMNKEN